MPDKQMFPLPKKSAVFLACNKKYLNYAAACIHSIFKSNREFTVNLFTTNVMAADLLKYPFIDDRVKIFRRVSDFEDEETERNFTCNERFIRYATIVQEYDFVVFLDVDQLVIKSFDKLYSWIKREQATFAIHKRPQEEECRQVRACCIAAIPDKKFVDYLASYRKLISNDVPINSWYSDQICLSRALTMVPDMKVLNLNEQHYCSFKLHNDCYILATCTENKLEFSKDYAKRYAKYACEIVDRRQYTGKVEETNKTAVVYVTFGKDEKRITAFKHGIEATLKSRTSNHLYCIFEACDEPTFFDISKQYNLYYKYLKTGERHQGVWQKENLWQIAYTTITTTFPQIQNIIYLDADCTPNDPSFIARVQDVHSFGLHLIQPWQYCYDTRCEDIGGLSLSWSLCRNGDMTPPYRAQPGFCWSCTTQWLKSIGGWTAIEPLGGGDTLLCKLFVHGDVGFPAEAVHMQEAAKRATFEKHVPAAINITLTHQWHGGRDTRQYRDRHKVAALVGQPLMSLYERDQQGLLKIIRGRIGDAWLLMLKRRKEWSHDENKNKQLWRECLESV